MSLTMSLEALAMSFAMWSGDAVFTSLAMSHDVGAWKNFDKGHATSLATSHDALAMSLPM